MDLAAARGNCLAFEPRLETRAVGNGQRTLEWTAPKNDFQSGALWRYAQTVGPACKGAVTHPGAGAETHVYADI